jgi:hypothetical protein
LEKWKRPGKKLEPWPKTGSTGGVSLKPYAPEGVKGNKYINMTIIVLDTIDQNNISETGFYPDLKVKFSFQTFLF